MKKALLLLLFCLVGYVGHSQGAEYDDVYPSDVIQPKFNGGGLDKFYDFIKEEFDFKKVTKSGKIVASFTIDLEGNLKDIRLVQFIDVDSATEMIRVLKKSPKWECARRGGKPFSVKIRFPLDFK